MDILAIIISVITFMVSLKTVLVVYILYNKLKAIQDNYVGINKVNDLQLSNKKAIRTIAEQLKIDNGRARRNTQALWDKIREVENKISIPNNPPKDKSKKKLTFIPHEE